MKKLITILQKLFKKDKYFLITLAIISLFWTLYVIVSITPDDKAINAEFEPYELPNNQNAHIIAGLGIIQTISEEIIIQPRVNGIVEKIYFKEASKVKKGEVIIKIENQKINAEIKIKERLLDLSKTKALQAKNNLSYYENLTHKDSISKQEYEKIKYEYLIANDNFKINEAELNHLKLERDFHLIRAPIDGEILKLSTKEGQYVNIGSTNLAIIGDTTNLYVRAEIDEFDIAKLNKVIRAEVRSKNSSLFTADFIKIIPYIEPKINLKGVGAEMIDSRVLKILFRINQPVNLFVGEQVDVYITTN